eukprot:15463991-Alexandrium_andersonii.AAC.1
MFETCSCRFLRVSAASCAFLRGISGGFCRPPGPPQKGFPARAGGAFLGGGPGGAAAPQERPRRKPQEAAETSRNLQEPVSSNFLYFFALLHRCCWLAGWPAGGRRVVRGGALEQQLRDKTACSALQAL